MRCRVSIMGDVSRFYVRATRARLVGGSLTNSPTVCVSVCVCVFFCARVPPRVRAFQYRGNATFLVKVFIRFLAEVPNFPNAPDTYVYLCIIYHNVSRAQFMYISVTAKSR